MSTLASQRATLPHPYLALNSHTYYYVYKGNMIDDENWIDPTPPMALVSGHLQELQIP